MQDAESREPRQEVIQVGGYYEQKEEKMGYLNLFAIINKMAKNQLSPPGKDP